MVNSYAKHARVWRAICQRFSAGFVVAVAVAIAGAEAEALAAGASFTCCALKSIQNNKRHAHK